MVGAVGILVEQVCARYMSVESGSVCNVHSTISGDVGNRGNIAQKNDSKQVLALIKGPIPNGGNTGRKRYISHTYATAEGSFFNDSKTTFRNRLFFSTILLYNFLFYVVTPKLDIAS